jgi:hypothetical protein
MDVVHMIEEIGRTMGELKSTARLFVTIIAYSCLAVLLLTPVLGSRGAQAKERPDVGSRAIKTIALIGAGNCDVKFLKPRMEPESTHSREAHEPRGLF